MQLSLQPKIIILESEINHSWQYAIKPKDEPTSKYNKIKLVAQLKEITMFACKVPLEIRFACETLNHQDSKKFKNFENKANVMECCSWFILLISAKTKLQLNSNPQTSSSPKYLDLTMRSQ